MVNCIIMCVEGNERWTGNETEMEPIVCPSFPFSPLRGGGGGGGKNSFLFIDGRTYKL